ncbi:hypothetical protein M758_12G172500 [Ceratodon purpureus]|nr:hypothetical protein M758_12G172500 [Ceratodon purpureus]
MCRIYFRKLLLMMQRAGLPHLPLEVTSWSYQCLMPRSYRRQHSPTSKDGCQDFEHPTLQTTSSTPELYRRDHHCASPLLILEFGKSSH